MRILNHSKNVWTERKRLKWVLTTLSQHNASSGESGKSIRRITGSQLKFLVTEKMSDDEFFTNSKNK